MPFVYQKSSNFSGHICSILNIKVQAQLVLLILHAIHVAVHLFRQISVLKVIWVVSATVSLYFKGDLHHSRHSKKESLFKKKKKISTLTAAINTLYVTMKKKEEVHDEKKCLHNVWFGIKLTKLLFVHNPSDIKHPGFSTVQPITTSRQKCQHFVPSGFAAVSA